jgi:hypothetical protein
MGSLMHQEKAGHARAGDEGPPRTCPHRPGAARAPRAARRQVVVCRLGHQPRHRRPLRGQLLQCRRRALAHPPDPRHVKRRRGAAVGGAGGAGGRRERLLRLLLLVREVGGRLLQARLKLHDLGARLVALRARVLQARDELLLHAFGGRDDCTVVECMCVIAWV